MLTNIQTTIVKFLFKVITKSQKPIIGSFSDVFVKIQTKSQTPVVSYF